MYLAFDKFGMNCDVLDLKDDILLRVGLLRLWYLLLGPDTAYCSQKKNSLPSLVTPIRRDRRDFMSTGVFSTLKFFCRIGRQFCVGETTLKSPCSLSTLKDIWRILERQSNTFGVFSDYDKTLLAYSQNLHKE